MTERRDPFQAIADPTRREILELLQEREKTVNEVAEHFDISRPAISRHLRILHECGLITFHQSGRERFCQAQLAALFEISDWLNQFQNFWNQRLNKLEDELNKNSNNP